MVGAEWELPTRRAQLQAWVLGDRIVWTEDRRGQRREYYDAHHHRPEQTHRVAQGPRERLNKWRRGGRPAPPNFRPSPPPTHCLAPAHPHNTPPPPSPP